MMSFSYSGYLFFFLINRKNTPSTYHQEKLKNSFRSHYNCSKFNNKRHTADKQQLQINFETRI